MTNEEERTVFANGVELCVEVFGDPADPAILLLHGAGNSMISWDEELCERLAAESRFVIRYDSRDSGRSATYPPGEPPYGLRDLVLDAVALLDALAVGRAHLVGLSGGAAVAQLVGLDHPDRTASLTLVCSTPGGPGHEASDLPAMTDEIRAAFEAEGAEPDWSDRAAVVEYLVEAERPFAGASFDEDAMRVLAERTYDRARDIAAQLSNPFLLDPGEPWRDRLGQLDAPTLVIHGTHDPMFPYAHGIALAEEVPHGELLPLDGVGHEYFPRRTWDRVVPAIVQHTARD